MERIKEKIKNNIEKLTISKSTKTNILVTNNKFKKKKLECINYLIPQ